MNCDQVRESLLEYLLNELSVDTKYAIDSHLSQGCPICLASEREIAEGFDVLFQALPDDSLSPNHRAAILAGASNPERHLRVPSNFAYPANDCTESKKVNPVFQHLLFFAAGLLLMMSVSSLQTMVKSPEIIQRRDSTSQSDAFAVDPSTIPKGSEMSEEKYAKTLQVSMHRTDVSSVMEGHILWDALNHEVHFFGSGIASPPNGMHYVLWLLDEDNHALAAQQLMLDATGKCKATANSRMGGVRFIIITLESKLGLYDRPSSNIKLSLDAIRFHSTSL